MLLEKDKQSCLITLYVDKANPIYISDSVLGVFDPLIIFSPLSVLLLRFLTAMPDYPLSTDLPTTCI